MEPMQCTKVHVDSRWKQPSESHSDFSIKLSQSIMFGDEVSALIDNITIPNTFYTVNGSNDTCYISEYVAGAGYVRKVTLAHGNLSGITFSTSLQNALNSLGVPLIFGSNPSRILLMFLLFSKYVTRADKNYSQMLGINESHNQGFYPGKGIVWSPK